MAGNVQEWVADWYASDYYANSPEANPTGPESSWGRVVRGSMWGTFFQDGRSTARNATDPTGPVHGIRCARSVASP